MIKEDPKTLKKTAEGLGKQLGKNTSDGQNALIKQLLEKGIKPKDIIGLNDTMVEGIYGQAYRLYNSGKYKDAIHLFRLLIMLNSTDPKYTMGLAACYHMMKDYDNAVAAYTMCSVIDPLSPIPHYHVSDCYLKLDDKRSALISLELALQRVGEKPEFATIKDRISRSIETLTEEIKKEAA